MIGKAQLEATLELIEQEIDALSEMIDSAENDEKAACLKSQDSHINALAILNSVAFHEDLIASWRERWEKE